MLPVKRSLFLIFPFFCICYTAAENNGHQTQKASLALAHTFEKLVICTRKEWIKGDLMYFTEWDCEQFTCAVVVEGQATNKYRRYATQEKGKMTFGVLLVCVWVCVCVMVDEVGYIWKCHLRRGPSVAFRYNPCEPEHLLFTDFSCRVLRLRLYCIVYWYCILFSLWWTWSTYRKHRSEKQLGTHWMPVHHRAPCPHTHVHIAIFYSQCSYRHVFRT